MLLLDRQQYAGLNMQERPRYLTEESGTPAAIQ